MALQLGGSEPAELAECAAVAQAWGYDEVNLNVGCPSDRVQKGRFGACLMKEPALVRDCLAAMVAAVDIPVTVKCRLGVDELYSYDYFRDFVLQVMDSGRGCWWHMRASHICRGSAPRKTVTCRRCTTTGYTGSSRNSRSSRW